MNHIIADTERAFTNLLGAKRDGVFNLGEIITVKVECEKDSPYLWIRDLRGEYSFAWLFNISKSDNGYVYLSDKDEIIECNSLEEVFTVVKNRKY